MNPQVKTLYRQIRTPHTGRYAGTGAVYYHQVTSSAAYKAAVYAEKVNRLWSQHSDTVRLRVEPDTVWDIDDLAGDMFSHTANPDIQPHVLDKQKKEFEDSIRQDGVWGIIGEYKCPHCGHWKEADSLWGFVGDDWKESGNDLDVKSTTLEAAGLWNES